MKNDNPPAFPRPISESLNPNIVCEPQEGMTLRDYFAGQTIAGLAIESTDCEKLDCWTR